MLFEHPALLVRLILEESAHVAGVLVEGGLAKHDLILQAGKLDDFHQKLDHCCRDHQNGLADDFQKHSQLDRG